MFPNQLPPPSTAADANTSQTATQATATQGSPVGQGVVAAFNTANVPATSHTETSAISAEVVSSPQSRRAHPYRRPDPAAPTPASGSPSAVTAAILDYQQVAAATGAAPAASTATAASVTAASGFWWASTLDEIRIAQRTGSALTLRTEQDTAPVSSLQAFFAALSSMVPILWNGNYSCLPMAGGGPLIGKGSVAPSTLSFRQEGIDLCTDPALKELLIRANSEENSARRAFLFVKAMRAFSESVSLWPWALVSFGILLGLNSNAVTSWAKTLPAKPTLAARDALGGHPPLTIKLPIELLSFPELIRLLQDYIPLTRSATASQSPAAISSTMDVFFEENFIGSQNPELAQRMRDFNQETDMRQRNDAFAKIICALKEALTLPEGTFVHACNLVNVSPSNVSSWYSKYKQRAATGRTTAPRRARTGPQTRAAPTPRLTLQPAALPAATSTAVAPAVTVTAALSAATPITSAPVPQSLLQLTSLHSTAPNLLAAIQTPTRRLQTQSSTLTARPLRRIAPAPSEAPTVVRPLPLLVVPLTAISAVNIAQASVIQGVAPQTSAPTAVTSGIAPVTTTGLAPLVFPAPTSPPTTVSTAAVLPAQAAIQPALSPVFTAPETTANTTTAQLAPVVQPFLPSTSELSLEELLAPDSPLDPVSPQVDVSMDLDESELLDLFED